MFIDMTFSDQTIHYACNSRNIVANLFLLFQKYSLEYELTLKNNISLIDGYFINIHSV